MALGNSIPLNVLILLGPEEPDYSSLVDGAPPRDRVKGRIAESIFTYTMVVFCWS
jgi:hypothetical protein